MREKIIVKALIIFLLCFSLLGCQSRKITDHSVSNAYYYESWDEGLGDWGTILHPAHISEGGYRNGFIRFSEPATSIDYNHSKMGGLHLVCWRYIGEISKKYSAFLGGGDADFRGAKVYISIRGNNFKPNGAELFWWSNSQIKTKVLPSKNPKMRFSNWAYVSFPLTDYLLDGQWHRVEFILVNDESKWRYAGNNWMQKNANRYAYWPLNEVLAHSNSDFLFILAFVDKDNPPTGSIDFDELEIYYHDKRLDKE